MISKKIAIIGDMHLGVRKSNAIFRDYQKKSILEILDYCDAHGIKSIIQTGDMFDVRKETNTLTIQLFHWFLDQIKNRGMFLYTIPGNHDIYYREEIQPNTPEILLSYISEDYSSCFKVICEPEDISINGYNFFMVPWVCKGNFDKVNLAKSQSSSKYCLGHFEFDGFEMHKGQPAKTHFTHKDYSKFDLVISGHFHHWSKKDNVHYTGTPYQLTWMDYNDDKGFWVFDNGDMEFVKNRNTIFNKIEYSDGFLPDKEEVNGKFIQLIVRDRIVKKEFESYKNALALLEPLEVKIKETIQEELSEEVIVNYSTMSTEEILREYIEGCQIQLDTDKMLRVLLELHSEALNNE